MEVTSHVFVGGVLAIGVLTNNPVRATPVMTFCESKDSSSEESFGNVYPRDGQRRDSRHHASISKRPRGSAGGDVATELTSQWELRGAAPLFGGKDGREESWEED